MNGESLADWVAQFNKAPLTAWQRHIIGGLMDVETSETPPECDHEDGDEGTVVHVSIHDTTTGVYRDANVQLDTVDPEELCEALMQAIRGIAAMHGPELQVALARRLI